MGYGYYEINRFDTQIPMKRGYLVPCKCHKKGCTEKIDRGLAYLCYNCGWYFCGKHLIISASDKNDDFIDVECFAGSSGQVCNNCAKKLAKTVQGEY